MGSPLPASQGCAFLQVAQLLAACVRRCCWAARCPELGSDVPRGRAPGSSCFMDLLEAAVARGCGAGPPAPLSARPDGAAVATPPAAPRACVCPSLAVGFSSRSTSGNPLALNAAAVCCEPPRSLQGAVLWGKLGPCPPLTDRGDGERRRRCPVPARRLGTVPRALELPCLQSPSAVASRRGAGCALRWHQHLVLRAPSAPRLSPPAMLRGGRGAGCWQSAVCRLFALPVSILCLNPTSDGRRHVVGLCTRALLMSVKTSP